MKRDFKQALAQFVRDKKRKRQRVAAVSVLSVAVVFTVVLNLVQPAITLTPDPICGMAEHLHGPECYETRLVCGMDGVEGHGHTDGCYEQTLVCYLPEHLHDALCYPEEVSDPVLMPSDEEPVPEALDEVDLMSVTVDAAWQPAILDLMATPSAVYPGQNVEIEFYVTNAARLDYRISRNGDTVFGGSAPVEARHYRWSLSPDGNGGYRPTVNSANENDGNARFTWSWTPETPGEYTISLEAVSADGAYAAMDSGVSVVAPDALEAYIVPAADRCVPGEGMTVEFLHLGGVEPVACDARVSQGDAVLYEGRADAESVEFVPMDTDAPVRVLLTLTDATGVRAEASLELPCEAATVADGETTQEQTEVGNEEAPGTDGAEGENGGEDLGTEPGDAAVTDLPGDGTPAVEAPADEIPEAELPTGDVSNDDVIVDEIPTGDVPADEVIETELPTGDVPTDETVTDEIPVEDVSIDEATETELPETELPADDTSVDEGIADAPEAQAGDDGESVELNQDPGEAPEDSLTDEPAGLADEEPAGETEEQTPVENPEEATDSAVEAPAEDAGTESEAATGDETDDGIEVNADDMTGDAAATDESADEPGETASEQAEGETGEESGDETEEAEKQSGDEAGEESEEESDDDETEETEKQPEDESEDETEEESEEEAGEESDGENEEAEKQSGDEAEDESEDESEEETGEESEEETEEESEEEAGEETDGEAADEAEAYRDGSLTFEGEGYAVELRYTADARIPENAALVITEQSGEALEQSVALALEALRADETDEAIDADVNDEADQADEAGEAVDADVNDEADQADEADGVAGADETDADDAPEVRQAEIPAGAAAPEAKPVVALTDARFFTAAIELDGEPVQPEAGVALTLTLNDAADAIFRVADGAAEVLPGAVELEISDYAGEAFGFGVVRVTEPRPEPVSEPEPELIPEPFTLTYDGGDYQLSVVCAPECGLPEGTELRVETLAADSEDYERAALAANEALNARDIEAGSAFAERLEGVALLSLRFEADGETVEPQAALPVTLTVQDEGVEFFLADENAVTLLEGDGQSACDDEYDGGLLGFGRMLHEQVGTVQLSAEGDGYTVTAAYGPEAALPEGTELRVVEILPGTQAYEDYMAQVGQMLSESWDEVTDFARYFDISFIYNDEAVEPKAAVDVKVSFTDAIPVAEDASLQAVHFAEEAPELIDVETKAENVDDDAVDTLAFSADSFSVYGFIQTGKLTQKVITAEGERFTIEVSYSQEAGIPDGAELTARQIMADTEEYGDYVAQSLAAIDADLNTNLSLARFFDIEIVKDGSVIEPIVPVDVKITCDDPVEMTEADTLSVVHFAVSGTEVIEDVILSEDGREMTYQQGSFSVTGTLITNPPEKDKRYAVVIHHTDGRYYAVQFDGTLAPVTYRPENNTAYVDMNNPLMWQYYSVHTFDGNNYGAPYTLRHTKDARAYDVGRDGATALPTAYTYRYLNVNTDSGLADIDDDREVAQNRNLLWWSITEYDVGAKRLHGESSNDRRDNYLGVREENGELKIRGLARANEAAEVFLAEAQSVPPVDAREHTVNHIDISVEAKASISVPLAYGEYLLARDNGDGTYTIVPGKTLTVNKNDKVYVTGEKTVPIDQGDLKVADISAYTLWKGYREELNDSYYVSGYSGNEQASNDTPQVRLEGSFKVSDMLRVPDGVDYNDPNIRAERLQKKIYYTVTLTKPVDFTMKWKDENDEEYIVLKDNAPFEMNDVSVTLSSSFSFWDIENTCPGTWILGVDSWQQGKLDSNEWWNKDQMEKHGIVLDGGPGMDFRLGGMEEGDRTISAIEITKYVMTTDGETIAVKQAPEYSMDIYAKAGNNYLDWYHTGMAEMEKISDPAGFTFLHNKKINIGESGVSLVYDYNVVPGTYYIREDKSMRDQDIVDANNNRWMFDSTRIETEYVWRNNQYGSKNYHRAGLYSTAEDSFNSVPDMLGEYELPGYKEQNANGDWVNPYNTFLEFNVYNYYRPKTYPVALMKVETGNAGNKLPGAEFDLYGPYTQEETEADGFNPLQTSKQLNASLENNQLTVTKYTTDGNGLVYLGELESGIYYLDETRSPGGYNLIDGYVKITVDSRRETSGGRVVSYEQTGNSATDVSTQSVTVNGQQVDAYTITVTNSRGYELPETGGAGTDLLTLGGLAIMLISAMLYGCGIRRRRERGAAR